MTDPSDFMSDFMNLMTDKSQMILQYLFYPVSSYPYSFDSMVTSSSVGNIPIVVQSASTINQLKGLLNQSGVSATIGDIAITTELSISMSLTISDMTDESVFLTYIVDG